VSPLPAVITDIDEAAVPTAADTVIIAAAAIEAALLLSILFFISDPSINFNIL
jgi:hypothetical protein